MRKHNSTQVKLYVRDEAKEARNKEIFDKITQYKKTGVDLLEAFVLVSNSNRKYYGKASNVKSKYYAHLKKIKALKGGDNQ